MPEIPRTNDCFKLRYQVCSLTAYYYCVFIMKLDCLPLLPPPFGVDVRIAGLRSPSPLADEEDGNIAGSYTGIGDPSIASGDFWRSEFFILILLMNMLALIEAEGDFADEFLS